MQIQETSQETNKNDMFFATEIDPGVPDIEQASLIADLQ